MCKLFCMLLLNFIIMCSLNASIGGNISQEEVVNSYLNVKSLFIEQIDLPETLIENIRSLNEEIKHTWPDAKYYRETIDFGIVFPALEEGCIIERPIPDFVAEICNQLFQVFKNQINDNVTADDYDNCIITIYQSGNGIAPHIDEISNGQIKAKIANTILMILLLGSSLNLILHKLFILKIQT